MKQRHPIFFSRLLMLYENSVGLFFRAIMGDAEDPENVGLTLEPLPGNRAAVASDGKPISKALARNVCSSAQVAVGVSRFDETMPMLANGLTSGNLPGFRRETTFHARRHDFIA